ncbi:MAG: YihY/virulence factor BrkB family protein [Deltaproteobacteria bacterium]|nr:YihY/virulence factor BrkB family protein [Deltaproteobacteria bacterium]
MLAVRDHSMTHELRRKEVSEGSIVVAVGRAAVRAEIDVQAAQIAFNAVFSLGPILALSSSLFTSLFGPRLESGLRLHLLPLVPRVAQSWVGGLLRSVVVQPDPIVLVGSMLVLLWSISSTTGSIATALSHVGWRNHATWLGRRTSAIVLGLGLVLSLSLTAFGAIVGPEALDWVESFLPGLSLWNPIFELLRWPLMAVVVALMSALTYRYATAERPKLIAALVGGTATSASSVLASLLLRIYLGRFASLDAWGAAAGVFALLLWLWLLSMSLLLGAVVAFVLDTRAHTRDDVRVPIRRNRGRGSARRKRPSAR